ncbi:MAG: tRNA (adenosine(37)-N6)-dimethylallyltransferase MiaA [Cyclobacteriaceae bacterium]|nr:tRNA (adenosine(37)-N6)-dimethylallyltransferase MiaA [Cyclobacteriaceae bacterium]
MDEKTVVVVVGPTAVGKTGVAIRLAEYFKTEIVSADSRQIYRELEIGTAKPDQRELARVPHHFINTQSIHSEYDAGTYGREARAVIAELLHKHSVVVVCGGSGLYIKSVLEGFDEMPEVAPGIRQSIVDEYEQKGLAWLQQQVAESDPDYFEEVDKQNSQRLMRALEVIRSTGAPFSNRRKKKSDPLPYRIIKIGLTLDREELYNRIDTRMDDMIANGLFAEAEKFYSLRHLNALQTVGYQEIFGFLEGKYDREETVRLLKRNSRRYAKRQLTWFRRDSDVRWYRPDDWESMIQHIQHPVL